MNYDSRLSSTSGLEGGMMQRWARQFVALSCNCNLRITRAPRGRASSPFLTSLIPILILTSIVSIRAGGAHALGANDTVRVRYGYFDEAHPGAAACGRGWLNLAMNVPENLPAYEVECFPQTVGTLVASRLDNAELDIAQLGSAPWAESIARGLPLKEIYAADSRLGAEGIYVRGDDDTQGAGYVGIKSPIDLVNRTIAAPFGSTIHYQLLFLIEQFGLQGQVDLINLSPTEIVQAWADPDHNPFIDGAACWGTAREYLLANGANLLISAAVISDWGASTFHVVAARQVFVNENPHFMKHMVGIMSRLDDSFRDSLGGKDKKNAERWNILELDNVSFMGSLVDSLMIGGEDPGDPGKDLLLAKREELDLISFLTASEMLTCNVLGNAIGNCTKPTGHHVALTRTGKFLLQQKDIFTLGIMAHIDNTCNDLSSFCGGDIIDPTYLALARTGNVSTPLGPYNETLYVDSDLEQSGPDVVLGKLENLDNGQSPYAANEVGRASKNATGDSKCTKTTTFDGTLLLNGTFGDGANALPGRSYSDMQHCQWTIYPLNGLVEVRVQRLRLWSGDFIRIYSSGPECPGNKPRSLLAQLSGMYDDEELPRALPPFRSSTCIVVEFVTDGHQERGYAVDEAYGDGFEIFFSRDGVPEDDCDGKYSDGLCHSFCLGTTRVKIRDDEKHVLMSHSNATKEALSSFDGSNSIHPYPNDLNCTYELDFGNSNPSFDLAKVELYYDLEETFDLLRLKSGAGENSTQFKVISGRHSADSEPEVHYIPVTDGLASLHLTTDDKGRRRGFHAEISGQDSSELFSPTHICDAGSFGLGCESKFCLQNNTFHKNLQGIESQYIAGRVTSQDLDRFIRAMPWAPEGGCVWEMKSNYESNGAIRLFLKTFDLESYPDSAIGDKLIIESSGVIHTLFVESCNKNETCDESWQTGVCIRGGCSVSNEIELTHIGANIKLRLATDRNDGGKNFSGVDFDVHFVQPCTGTNISCYNGLCTCDSIACDCVSESPAESGLTKAGTIGVFCAVLLFLFVMFLFYRHKNRTTILRQQTTIHKNKTTILKQQTIIEENLLQLDRKEAELDAFRLGTSKFGDAVAFIDSLLKPGSPLADASEVENLLLVKRCIIRDVSESKMHIPDNLTKANPFIMREFAGVADPQPNLQTSNNFLSMSREHTLRQVIASMDCLPEFVKLDTAQQTILFEILSFPSLKRWEFNIFDVSAIDEENNLLFVAWAVMCSPHSQFAMAKELGRTADLNPKDFDGYDFDNLGLHIDAEALCDYLRVIERDYNANPYHNAVHAADVVQTLHSLIQLADDGIFEKEEMFTILFASVIHDVKHPGMNNIFQVNTFSNLALNHNDKSVLESEHSSHAFKLMVQGRPGEVESLNFLCHVEPSKFAEIRTRVVESVLHTDMSRHFATVAKIKSQAAGKSWDEIDPDVRWEVLMYMLHLADISNPAKANPMFMLWTDRCLQEFFAQGDKERELGLPISPNCDKNTTKKPDSQIGFINFVVKPAYLVLADIIPAVGKYILPTIENNLIYWEGQKGREETV